MLMTVKEFCTTVGDTASLNRLVADLRRATGRGGAREEESWRSSLPILAEAVGEQYFEGIHLFFAGAGDVALEYRLPNSPKWCDVVLIGRNHERASVVIVELKHWNTASDVRGRYTGLMQRHFGDAIHPADQVQGYVEYCRAFHSAVQHRDAQVDGCVFFTQAAALAEYRAAPNESLATTYPLFSTRPAEFPAFPRYLRDRLTAPDAEFAHEFEHGRYSQPRSLCIQVGAQLADEKSSPFVLLDEQRTAFSVSMAEVTEAMSSDRKRVVIVQGPPGSGKSVVAARIWAKLAQDFGGEDRSVTMVTTSASQNSNWRSMFCQASGVRAADGFVLKANAYIPFTTHDQKAGTRDLGVVWRDASEWEKNLRLVEACGFGAKRIRDNDIGVSIVDEAHA
ncbi:MAG: DUF2075 domain-containing protein, partial [Gammaproteobacteria bacterium]|nr:DUF2075 domain-containing protein [Gammaproteobacteria bacterium]